LLLTLALDLFNREVVGWSIKPRITADIVIAVRSRWHASGVGRRRG
jgi:hypothetical protein